MDERNEAHDRELGDLIRAGATRHAPAPMLRAQLADAIRKQAAPEASRAQRARQWWPAGLAFACGALLSWLALSLLPSADVAGRIDADVVSAHGRAMMMARAVDVESSDQHTVKPWLSSRLDFSPPVPDLAADGFPLVGGRRDFIAGRPVAVLVYKRNAHVIDVFAWPSASLPARTAPTSRNGFNVIAWVKGELQYRAVSDISAAELAAFAESMQRRVAAGS